MKVTELPLLFVDSVHIGALTGTGESVQLTFASPHSTEKGVDQVPVVRVAMTRLAFLGLAELAQQVAKELNAAVTAAAAAKPN
ncbi:MAG TPA: hypothetical protein VF495_06620 [Phenylobacterium sp.]|jgi:hypothetical protein